MQAIPETPLVTSRRAPSLRDKLVSSHFQRPMHNVGRGRVLHGSYPCGDCMVCQYVIPTETFLHPSTGQSTRLQHYINCKSKMVVYAITCPCDKIYIGQTSQQLRKRIQKHLSTIALAQRDANLERHLPRLLITS